MPLPLFPPPSAPSVSLPPRQPYDREVFLPGFYQSSTLLSEGEEEEERRLGGGKTYIRARCTLGSFARLSRASFFLFGRLSCYVAAGMLLKSDEHRMETVELCRFPFFSFFFLFFSLFVLCLFTPGHSSTRKRNVVVTLVIVVPSFSSARTSSYGC